MNENKTQNTLIWIILAINALTLILLITLTVIGWNAISQKNEQSKLSVKEEFPIQPQAQQTKQAPTDTKQQPKTEGEIQGKCGDGICQPIEKEKGICSQDCN